MSFARLATLGPASVALAVAWAELDKVFGLSAWASYDGERPEKRAARQAIDALQDWADAQHSDAEGG